MKNNSLLPQAKHNIDYKDMARPYLQKWYWFLISVVACLLLCTAYLFITPSQYRVHATLQIPDDKLGGGLLKATAFSDLNMFHEVKTVDNEIEVLRSRDLLYRVLSKLDLGVSYFKRSLLKDQPLYGSAVPVNVKVLAKRRSIYQKKINITFIGKETFTISDGKVEKRGRLGETVSLQDLTLQVSKGPAAAKPGEYILVTFKDLSNLAASYADAKLKVTPVIRESSTLTLSLTDASPERGLAILNTLIEMYNETALRKKNQQAIQTIDFLNNRLAAMDGELNTTEASIEAYKQKNSASDLTAGSQLDLNKSAEYNRLLEESEVQLGIINQMLVYLRSSNHDSNLMPSTSGLKDASLITLVSKFNDLQMERDRLLRTAAPTNTLVQNLTGQIASLQSNLIENLTNARKSMMIENRHLRSNADSYISKVHAAPTVERQMLQRTREQGVKTNLYQYFLQKREETTLSLMTVVPVSEVIDKPSYDALATFPKTQLVYLAGSLLGLILPVGFIYGSKKLAATVNDSVELKQIDGLKILGELCHNVDRQNVVVTKNSRSDIAELFRYLRSNLQMMEPGETSKTILVTSCGKGEGKTFFCINMGLTLALLNKKVIVLEFDLRKPDLLRKMDMQQKQGISDYLNGDTDDFHLDIQRYNENSQLYTLGCGTLPDNPAELLSSPRLNMLFEKLRDTFDYIIVDTSPVGAVADAFSFAPYTDISVYLVRYNYTSNKQLDILKDIYEDKKLNNLMVVFNDAKPENRPVYAYGSYGYNTK